MAKRDSLKVQHCYLHTVVHHNDAGDGDEKEIRCEADMSCIHLVSTTTLICRMQL